MSAAQHHLLLEVALAGQGPRTNGTQAHFSFMTLGGRGVGEVVGDVQGVSNIEAQPLGRLYEAWIQIPVLGGQLLLGLYDLNRDFYVTETAALFLNGSHGIGPEFGLAGVAGPSIYPSTALGVRIQAAVSPEITVRGAMLDGVPGDPTDPSAWGVALLRDEGALLAVEAEWAGAGARARVATGGWLYTSSTAQAEDSSPGGANGGVYLLVEGDLAGCHGGACLRAFARAGRAAPRLSPVASALGAGLVLEASPDGVALGAAIATAAPGGGAGAAPLHAPEHNLELTVRIPLASSIELLPDLQVIRAPGMARGCPTVVVASVRVALRL